MTEKELQLIRLLRSDPRITINSMSKSLNMTLLAASDLFERVKKRYCLRFSTIFDYNKIFPNYRVFLVLEQKNYHESRICLKNVNNIYRIANKGMMIDIFFKNRAEHAEYIGCLHDNGIRVKRTIDIIEEFCLEKFTI